MALVVAPLLSRVQLEALCKQVQSSLRPLSTPRNAHGYFPRIFFVNNCFKITNFGMKTVTFVSRHYRFQQDLMKAGIFNDIMLFPHIRLLHSNYMFCFINTNFKQRTFVSSSLFISTLLLTSLIRLTVIFINTKLFSDILNFKPINSFSFAFS